MNHDLNPLAAFSACRVKIVFLLAAMAWGGGATAQATPAFNLTWNSLEAENSWPIALGDLNGDGHLDQAVGQKNQANRVYLGDGAGNFTAGWTSAETETTKALALGDMDRDGDLDMVAGNYNQPNRVYLNDGSGQFSLLWSSAESDPTRGIALGDMDLDGRLDIVVANNTAANRIYRNNGDGSFSLYWTSPDVFKTRSISLADYDGDGRPDLLTGNYIQANQVIRNKGNGQFEVVWTSPDQSKTREVAWADLDNDGDMDLLAGNYKAGNQVFRNDGNNVFTLHWTSAEARNTRYLMTGDFNGDGHLDFAAANYRQFLRVYQNNGDGTFAMAFAHNQGRRSRGVAWGDLDGDQDLDLVFSNLDETNQVFTNMQNPANTAPSIPAPATPTVTVEGNTAEVALFWQASSDTGTPANLLTYNVRVGTSPGGREIISPVTGAGPGNAGTARTSNATYARKLYLSASASVTTYYWAVEAVDTAFKHSGFSAEGSFTVTNDTTPPTAVSSLTDSGDYLTASTQLSAAWTVATDAGSGLKNHVVSLGASPGASGVVASQSLSVTASSYTFTGLNLMDGQTYYVNVAAVDQAGLTGSVTTTDGITVDTSAPTAVTVTDEEATTVNTTHLSASWTASVDAHSGISTYSVSVILADGTVISQSQTTGVSIVFTGLNLTVGTAYVIQVQSRNGAGLWSAVALADGVTVTAPPDTTPPSAVTGLTGGGENTISTSQLSASWTAATDNTGVTGYQVTLLNNGNTVSQSTVTGTSITFTGLNLTVGQTYVIRVIAVDAAGNTGAQTDTGGMTIVAPPDTTPPAAVTNLTNAGAATTVTSQLSASWTAATDNTGVTGYQVTLLNGGNTVSQSTVTGISIVFTGLNLTVGETYTVQVVALDAAGNTSATAQTGGITITAPPPPEEPPEEPEADTTPPAAVSQLIDGLSAGVDLSEQEAKDTLSANWSAATDPESGVTAYTVQALAAGGTVLSQSQLAATAVQITFTGLSLSAGQTYTVRVIAINGEGLSTSADTNGVLILEPPPSPPPALGIGDADGNGALSKADARRVLEHLTGVVTLTEAQKAVVNRVAEPLDQITVEDANLILRCVRGAIQGNQQYRWCTNTRVAAGMEVAP